MLTKSWKVWHWEKRQAESICKSSLTQVCLSKKSLDLTESNSVRDLELALDFLHERTAGVPIFPSCERSCPGWLTIGLEPLLHVAHRLWSCTASKRYNHGNPRNVITLLSVMLLVWQKTIQRKVVDMADPTSMYIYMFFRLLRCSFAHNLAFLC